MLEIPDTFCLTLLHSELPKLYGVLAILNTVGLTNARNARISSFHNGQLISP